MPNMQNEFVEFIQMLLDDEELQKWFISLSALSDNDRLIELRNFAIKMSHTKMDEDTARAVISLSDDEVYNGVRAVFLVELNQKGL